MVAYNFKDRFVAPICVGLDIEIPRHPGLKIAAGVEIKPKRQTIRAYGKRRHAREGETLQLYYAQRTRQCIKVAEAKCTEVHRIIIWPDVMAIMLNGVIMTARQIQRFARADGFADAADMQAFWRKTHGDEKFVGVMIRWEPLP